MKKILAFENISKKYSSFSLMPVSQDFELGKIYAIVGENAAGKTTLLRLIARDLLEDAGNCRYFFTEKEKANWQLVQNHIAYITQELAAWKGKLQDLIFHSAITHGLKPDFAKKQTQLMMQIFDIEQFAENNWDEISGGYKLRFTMAAAFVWQPKLVVMDEPLANLDISSQHLILELLKSFAHDVENPTCIIISSQHLAEIERTADDLIFLDNGKIIFSGNKKTFGTDRNHNIFELNTDLSLEALQAVFADEENITIRKVGYEFIIQTPLHYQSSDLFKTLASNKIEVDYFRNISQSSKKLFIHE